MKFTSSEAGNYFYKVVDHGATAPTADEIMKSTTKGTASTGEITFTLSNLTEDARDIYIVVVSAAGGESAPLKVEIPAYGSGTDTPDTGAYKISISAPKGGTITTNRTKADKGDEIIVTVTPDNGYQMVSGSLTYTLAIENGETVKITNNRFTMPDGNVSISCQWETAATTAKGITSFSINGVAGAVNNTTMAVAEAQSASVYRKASMLIKQIFADALTCDLIQVDPTTKYTFKRVRREKEDTGEEYLTDAQVATLLAAIKGIYPLETFVKLGLYAGLRREESLALQWDCVDLNADTPQIEVTRTCIFCHNRPEISNVTKTAAGHRNIPIPVPLFNHLKGIKKSVASDFVICNSSGLPLSETQFRNMWRKIKRRSVGPDEYIRYKQHGKKSHSVNREAGQTAAHNPNVRYIIDFPVKTHMLRKTYITNLIYSGVDVRTVMDYAGHKNPDITLKIYAQAKTAEKRTESAKQINEVFPSDPTT